MPSNLPENAPWDQFVGKTPGGDILQTTAWAETKKALGFSVGQIVLARNGEITGGGQIIVKRIGTPGGIGYIARGPLLAGRHVNQAALLLEQIEAWSRANRVRHLIVQPGEDADEVEAMLELRGYFGNAPDVGAHGDLAYRSQAKSRSRTWPNVTRSATRYQRRSAGRDRRPDWERNGA